MRLAIPYPGKAALVLIISILLYQRVTTSRRRRLFSSHDIAGREQILACHTERRRRGGGRWALTRFGLYAAATKRNACQSGMICSSSPSSSVFPSCCFAGILRKTLVLISAAPTAQGIVHSIISTAPALPDLQLLPASSRMAIEFLFLAVSFLSSPRKKAHSSRCADLSAHIAAVSLCRSLANISSLSRTREPTFSQRQWRSEARRRAGRSSLCRSQHSDLLRHGVVCGRRQLSVMRQLCAEVSVGVCPRVDASSIDQAQLHQLQIAL